MYRLTELSDSRRKAIGGALLLLGIGGVAVSVVWIHLASLDARAVINYFNWFPRGVIWKGIGYLVALGATTLGLVGGIFLFVLNQPMTWARATIAAFIAWIALVFYFGIVPSEWLNYAQSDFEWSGQEIALVIPPILVLGNTVEISFAVLTDSVSGGYHVVMLVAAAVLALQIQKMREGRPPSAERPEPKSPYGRPLVKGGS